MRQTLSWTAAVLIGAATSFASTSSQACELQPVDPVRIKQLMATEIGFRLGMGQRQFPLTAITAPTLHTPFGLDPLCRGLGSFHYSAGFRFAESWRIGPGPWLPGQPPAPAHAATPWPPYAQCSYEGVAVVLGYGEASPVAVHFTRSCS